MTRAETLGGYALLAIWLLACELRARRGGALPTFTALVRGAARWPLVRALLLAGWLWVGWHLFVRAHR
jgi:hypothetical protein